MRTETHAAPVSQGSQDVLQDQDDLNAEDLFHEVYSQLHGIARRCMADQPAGHTLQPTALISEVYLRLSGSPRAFADTTHFLRLASKAMRQVLVDHARRGQAQCRPPRRRRVDLVLEALSDQLELRSGGLNRLDAALGKLERQNPDQVQLVELHFFAGQTMEVCAKTLGVSERQAYRWWKKARAFLYHELH